MTFPSPATCSRDEGCAFVPRCAIGSSVRSYVRQSCATMTRVSYRTSGTREREVAMKLIRDAIAVLLWIVMAGDASGQAWPVKPVHIVVAFTAGGTTDLLARNIGQQLGDRLKQPF